ncbi:MAG: amidohydrolase family protein, partial [Cellvibrionaceae bacterium]|nr:amidohydrolase family protein [Cellvibrionaceae bacterium]
MKLLIRLAKVLTALALMATVAWVIITIHFNPRPPAEQAFINAHILTMDKDNSIAEAILLREDKIVALGSNEEIKAQLKDPSNAIDLAGKTLMPGIIDAHGHFPGSGLAALAADLNSPPIGNVKTVADALARIKAQAQQTPAGEWVYAFGFDDTQIAEQRFLSRKELDKISTEHPIYVSHISGHMGIANSMAFAAVGYDKNTSDPEGGHIIRDKDGELAGLVEENAQLPLVYKALDIGPLKAYKMSRYAIDEYLQQGVTSTQVGLASPTFLKGISALGKLGIYPQRVVMWPDLNAAQMLLDGELSKTNLESERVKLGAVKLISDGSIQGYTGFLGHPYHIQPEGKQEYRGYPTMSQAELTEAVIKYHSLGWQIAVH